VSYSSIAGSYSEADPAQVIDICEVSAMLQERPDNQVQDRACPLPFMVTAAFATALLWLCAILGNITLP